MSGFLVRAIRMLFDRNKEKSNRRSYDYLRPSGELSSLIYDAFNEVAKDRGKYKHPEWILREREAVFVCVKTYALNHNLMPLSLKEIECAENYALGSADYGSKWAHRIVDMLNKKNKTSLS